MVPPALPTGPDAGGGLDADALGLRFHHVGVACQDLDSEAKRLAILGFRAEGPDFEDPIQGIRGRFLVGPGPRLELLVALPGRDTLAPWLASRIKMYHLAYEIPSIDEGIRKLTAARARLVTGPVPAVAFGGRPIAFLMLPNMLLVELIGDDVPAPG